jgi:hypothetical protein
VCRVEDLEDPMKTVASKAGYLTRRDPGHRQESETSNPIEIAGSLKQVVLGGQYGSF